MIKNPPSISEQFSDLLDFVVHQCYENQDLDQLPIGPPTCELTMKPIKYGIMAGREGHSIPMGLYHPDWRGVLHVNARDCPHCLCLHFNNASVGSIVKCTQCKGKFIW